MGDNRILFFRDDKLPPRIMGEAFWIDICENIHLHYRDLRLEFSLSEYIEFMDHLTKMYRLFDRWREENPDWKEDEMPFKQKEFERLYRIAWDYPEKIDLTPKRLVGFYELDNSEKGLDKFIPSPIKINSLLPVKEKKSLETKEHKMIEEE